MPCNRALLASASAEREVEAVNAEFGIILLANPKGSLHAVYKQN